MYTILQQFLYRLPSSIIFITTIISTDQVIDININLGKYTHIISNFAVGNLGFIFMLRGHSYLIISQSS